MTIQHLIGGTATLGKLNSEQQVLAMLDRLVSAGISVFDTAPAYGSGMMEAVLGRFIRSHPDAANIRVNTKFGLLTPLAIPWLDRFYLPSKVLQVAARKAGMKRGIPQGHLAEFAASSLARSTALMGEKVIDVFLAHEVPLDALNHPDFLHFIRRAKASGLIRRFGLGGYRRQYETPTPSPIWDEVDVVQVDSSPGKPLVLPPGWRGEIYLHSVIANRGVPWPSEPGERKKVMNGIFREALDVQQATMLVTGFSRAETLEETRASLAG